jgi:hypothetical protein
VNPARRGAPHRDGRPARRDPSGPFGPEATLAPARGHVKDWTHDRGGKTSRGAPPFDRAPRDDDASGDQDTVLAQARHLVASAGIVSLQNGQALTFGPSGAGSGLSSALVIVKTTKAMMMKSMRLPRNAP